MGLGPLGREGQLELGTLPGQGLPAEVRVPGVGGQGGLSLNAIGSWLWDMAGSFQ